MKKKRSIVDDIIDAGREILEAIRDALNPNKKRRAPVPVPVRHTPER